MIQAPYYRFSGGNASTLQLLNKNGINHRFLTCSTLISIQFSQYDCQRLQLEKLPLGDLRLLHEGLVMHYSRRKYIIVLVQDAIKKSKINSLHCLSVRITPILCGLWSLLLLFARQTAATYFLKSQLQISCRSTARLILLCWAPLTHSYCDLFDDCQAALAEIG